MLAAIVVFKGQPRSAMHYRSAPAPCTLESVYFPMPLFPSRAIELGRGALNTATTPKKKKAISERKDRGRDTQAHFMYRWSVLFFCFFFCAVLLLMRIP